jgi:hypothetical protein
MSSKRGYILKNKKIKIAFVRVIGIRAITYVQRCAYE